MQRPLDIYQILGILSLTILSGIIVLALVLFFTKPSKRFVFVAGYTTLGVLILLSFCVYIIYQHYHG